MCSLQVPLRSICSRASTRGRVGYPMGYLHNAPPLSSRCCSCPIPSLRKRRLRQVATFGLFDSIKQKLGAGEGISSGSSNSYAAVEKMDYYDKDEVLLYFDYIGLLATEGSYDLMNQLLEVHSPGNVLLLLASRENDAPKIAELLAAGADLSIQDTNGKTPMDLASKPEALEVMKAHLAKQAGEKALL
ncbi:hypothetical protein DUNSADRAFT_8654 [Dunaliella salina]|uniref:Uncharacterized protein n=1 Tax=Dunaliella salina TaxID=3046 RepID=A0ABQ7GJ27_DUNSA|nr:hypothetical protein DUNSADRAFT_8654 [Dunaliella salina]|eukprot:KAF5834613.1 hypothetical protein DUNSADRAFT_8654 [Dunaliella salina]